MKDIQGQITPTERELLKTLPGVFNALSVIEIGALWGGSTSAFANGMDEGEIFCIDPFCFYRYLDESPGQLQRFLDNTKGWQAEKPLLRVTPLIGTVTTTAIRYFLEERISNPFDLAFIDGAHDASSALIDLACIVPVIKFGGCVALHDHNTNYGIQFATSVYEKAGLIVAQPNMGVDSIALFQRTDKLWDDKIGTFVRGHFQ